MQRGFVLPPQQAMVTELGLDMFGEREDNLFTEMDRRAGFPCTKHVLEGYGVAAALDLQHDAWGDIQRALESATRGLQLHALVLPQQVRHRVPAAALDVLGQPV